MESRSESESESQPKAVCQQGNHMSTIWDNKIYTLGGYDVVLVANGSHRHISAPYVNIFDFDATLISKGALQQPQAIRIPDDVPHIKWGSLWADDGKLYLYGGQYEVYPVQGTDGRLLNETRAVLDGQLWEYDIEKDLWAKLLRGRGSTGRSSWVTQGMSAFDSKNRVAYILGGVRQNNNTTSQYILGNGTTVPQNIPEVEIGVGMDLTDFSAYDMKANQWTDFRNNGTLLGPIQQGKTVYIESLGTMGVLVVLGGSAGSTMSMPRSMESINLYDIGTNTWYNQDSTAEGGIFPAGRKEFCAVTVPASDGSSHSIYIWGGASLDHQQHSLDDIWVLTLPYFHWASVGNSLVGRESMTCDLLWSKYMVASGGRDGSDFGEPGPEDCDPGQFEKGIAIFDVTSLRWVRDYDPPGTQGYRVPKRFYNIIGGNPDGNTALKRPGNVSKDHQMETMFQVTQSPDSTSSPSGIPVTELPKDTATPTAAIAAGVAVGVVIIIALVFAWFFRRRKLGRKEADTHEGQQDETELGKIVDAFGGPDFSGLVRNTEVADTVGEELRAVREGPRLPGISKTPNLEPVGSGLGLGKRNGRKSVFEEDFGLEVAGLKETSDLEISVI